MATAKRRSVHPLASTAAAALVFQALNLWSVRRIIPRFTTARLEKEN